ncbi:MAG TPA: histidine phosphatase family protein [Polyangia bacterium]|nr:histidine phosphatase family protein [Polyangia bacterium]
MKLLVIRHAIAEDREVFATTGQDDGLRPLTRAGKKKMARAARGLREIAPALDLLASSPLVRARQTADVVADVLGTGTPVELEALEPERDPAQLLEWLGKQKASANLAVVGHEPHLSRLIGLLLTGGASGFLILKKGGACLLDLPEGGRAGAARLRCALTPAQLRKLGG